MALPLAIVLPRARSVAVALAFSEARKLSLRPLSLTSVARGAVVSLLPEVPLPGVPEPLAPPDPAAAMVTGCSAVAEASPLSSTAYMRTVTVRAVA